MTVAAIFVDVLIVITSVQAWDPHKHSLDNQRAAYIAEGTEASPHEFPWLVSVQERPFHEEELKGRSVHKCGGSIINDEWILTAAHCFSRPVNNSIWSVIAGAHRISMDESSQQKFDIAMTISHHDYNETAKQNDIALAKIAGRFNFDAAGVAPIALPLSSDHEAFDNDSCVFMGWGLTSDGKSSDAVQKVQMPILKLNICETFYSEFVTEKHLCGGSLNTTFHTSTCEGDSGGPLSCLADGVYKLAGILSHSFPECPNSYPEVFVKMSSYRDWIDENATPVDSEESCACASISILIIAVMVTSVLCVRCIRRRRGSEDE